MVGTWKCKQNPGQVLLIPTGPRIPLVFFSLYLLEPIDFVPACNFLLMLWLFQLKTTRCCIPSPCPAPGPLLPPLSRTWRGPGLLFRHWVHGHPAITGLCPAGHGQGSCVLRVLPSSRFSTEFLTPFALHRETVRSLYNSEKGNFIQKTCWVSE